MFLVRRDGAVGHCTPPLTKPLTLSRKLVVDHSHSNDEAVLTSNLLVFCPQHHRCLDEHKHAGLQHLTQYLGPSTTTFILLSRVREVLGRSTHKSWKISIHDNFSVSFR